LKDSLSGSGDEGEEGSGPNEKKEIPEESEKRTEGNKTPADSARLALGNILKSNDLSAVQLKPSPRNTTDLSSPSPRESLTPRSEAAKVAPVRPARSQTEPPCPASTGAPPPVPKRTIPFRYNPKYSEGKLIILKVFINN
tara:strand:- start:1725 stop:2144 length:420 start_codon:yes stop_codon:yes gene_type:complete